MIDGPIFSSRQALATAFANGLTELLEERENLGTFILVMANAFSDDSLFTMMGDKVEARFRELKALYDRGELPASAEDDEHVLLSMMELGYESMERPVQRDTGPWHMQFNMLRSFRPPRAQRAGISSIVQAFDERKFNFNRPFLAKEIFWQGRFADHDVSLLYNKFPFMPLHGLWVPEQDKCHPQYLFEEMHHSIWDSCRQIGATISDVGMGYNSLGAGASVNHLHFQFFVDGPLPVESPSWNHHQGEVDYPVHCRLFESAEESWIEIEKLHQQNQPYNLIYRPGKLYLLPRAPQGSYENADWSIALTWNEMAGSFVLFDKSACQAMSNEDLSTELGKVAI